MNGTETIQDFEIIPDPRLNTTKEEYQAQFDFLIEVRDKVSEAHQAMIDISNIRDEVNFVKERVTDAQLTEQLNDFLKELERIENDIHQTKIRVGRIL